MNVQELRIGNWVINELSEGNPGQYEMVTGIFHDVKCYDSYWVQHGKGHLVRFNDDEEPDDTFIKPVPLTPEILTDWCGFVGGVKLQNFVDGRHQYMQKGSVYGHFSEKGYFDFCWGPRIKILYLHQLQNLYFALTGTELEIKINK